MASRKWPRYEVGHKHYIFALGVISVNFNELEGYLRLHFSMHVRVPADATDFLFSKLDNSQRIMLIRNCLAGHGQDFRFNPTSLPYSQQERLAIEHFTKGYAICAENRNILLHSQVHWAAPADSKKRRVSFYKDSRKPPYFPNRYIPSLKSLRAIADAMNVFCSYGSDLAWMLRDAYWMEQELGLKNVRRPLPRKPPLPKILVPKPFEGSSPPTDSQYLPEPS